MKKLAIVLLPLLLGAVSAPAMASDLRDARSLVKQTKREGFSELQRVVRQRDGWRGTSFTARKRDDGLYEVLSWRSKGTTQTKTLRTFDATGAEPRHLDSKSEIWRNVKRGSGREWRVISVRTSGPKKQ